MSVLYCGQDVGEYYAGSIQATVARAMPSPPSNPCSPDAASAESGNGAPVILI